MKIKKITKIHSDKKIPLYDVVNAYPHNNFLIKTNSGYIVSHNCAVLDEMDFVPGSDPDMTKSEVMKIYNSVKRRIESRFMRMGEIPGMLFMISSKKSENDFLEQYAEKQKDNPTTYIVDEPLWNIKPASNYSGKKFKVAVGNKFVKSKIVKDDEDLDGLENQGYRIIDVPIEHKRAFELDIDSALMDIAGIATTSKLKYISYDRLIKNYTTRKNPFTNEILEIGLDDNLEIKQFFKPEMIPEEIRYQNGFMHLDTSLTGDHTGISYVTIEGTKDTDKYVKKDNGVNVEKGIDFIFRQVFTIGIKAPTDSQISFEKTREFIYYLKTLGFNIQMVTCDGFQSADTIQLLNQAGIQSKLESLDKKPDGYETFKSSINEERLDLLDLHDTKLESEITDLEKDAFTNKVDHPLNGSKDESDSLAGAVFAASKFKTTNQYRFATSDLSNLTDTLEENEYDKERKAESELLGVNVNNVIRTKEDFDNYDWDDNDIIY